MKLKSLLLIPALLSLSAFSFMDTVGHTYSDHYGWKSSQIVDSSRVTMASGAEPSRYAGSTIKWIMEPNDDPLHNGSNRVEVLQAFNTSDNDENGASGIQTLGKSFYIPSGFTCPQTTPWFVVLQLHGPDSYGLSPAFSIDLCNYSNSGHFVIETNGGDVNNYTKTVVDLGPVIYDTWIDIVTRINFAADNTGQVTVWTRTNKQGILLQRKISSTNTGAAIPAWNTPTLYSDNGVVLPHYYKSGMYRTPKQSNTVTIFTGPFVRGNNFADVALHAYGVYP